MSYIKLRRIKLIKKILSKSLIVLYSGSLIKQSINSYYPFFVNRNFFYLSNISQENTILLIIKNNDNDYNEYLFIDKFDIKIKKWYGEKINKKKAHLISSIKMKNILFRNTLNKKIFSLIKKINIKNIYFDFTSNEKIIDEIKNKYNFLNIVNISPIINDLRLIKDKLEINNIIKAINITYLGFKEIFKKIKNYKYEIEIKNKINENILNNGTNELGFESIVATGINTCCLHNSAINRKIKKNDLILCDIGAAYNHYSSDISRTFPFNGKFSKIQKEIYEIVLNCNKKIIQMIKPGLTIKKLQFFTKKYLSDECFKKKIINNKIEIKKYYFHNISHHLGLDVHDGLKQNKKLQAGMVITVEPGLYFENKKIGIRIEDDILITKNGCINLSKKIPKEINEIEKMINE